MSFAGNWESMTKADVEAAQTADLIPKGVYEGQVNEIKVAEVDRPESPYYGTGPMARLTVTLFDVEGKERKYFFSATSAQKYGKNGQLLEPSKAGAYLAAATSTIGQDFADTLGKADQARFNFGIGLLPAKGEWDARNQLKSIKAVA